MEAEKYLLGGERLMKGKLFEELIRNILLRIGFSQIKSDGLYIFDGAPGQMIQGIGQAHNADVLLMPPAQTPFYFPSRLLIECKNYEKSIGLNVIRSALGLREDINSFELVDLNVLQARRNHRRKAGIYNYQRYYYQVAVAAFHDFSTAAQEFALAHRIPLISFEKLPFWNTLIPQIDEFCRCYRFERDTTRAWYSDSYYLIQNRFNEIANRMAIAMLDDGQMLFLYSLDEYIGFDENYYNLYWNNDHEYWILQCGKRQYAFQLPKKIREEWLKTSIDDLAKRENALNCKQEYLSHIVVYYNQNGLSKIKMLSINKEQLRAAYNRLKG